MEDWFMVFLALLNRLSDEQRQFIVEKYLNYFLSLADIEEGAAECSGVVSYGDTTCPEMPF
ncbi:hypothetical protein B0H14DRAFT_3450505 [Mycena olivaceomarginata]|nr:hypothetical protein B0H14DRAFT_3450505 [Mycena olivaceomarginata]